MKTLVVGNTGMNFYRWMTSSLRTKMLSMFVMLTAIPLILVGMITYSKSYNTVTEHSIATTELVAEHLKNEIDVLFSDNRKFLDITKNPNVLRFLTIQNETYDEAKEILKTFSLYRDTYRYSGGISNILLFNLYGKGISEKKGVFQMEDDLSGSPQLQDLLLHPDRSRIIPPSAAGALDSFDHAARDNHPTISIAATVKREITDEVIGFIVINLDASVIENLCNSSKIGDTGFFYVTDEQGRPIITPERVMASGIAVPLGRQRLLKLSGNYTSMIGGQNRFIVYATSELTGWKVVGEVPLREVVKDAKQIENLILVSVLFAIAFTITLYVFVSSRLIRPIRILKNKMRQAASGFLDAKVHGGGTMRLPIWASASIPCWIRLRSCSRTA
ncbi:cache domain-containing protein [Paenibacillus sp. P25]|nr:cache domain-containing protein [Paenibacillus sp. P25]